ncbi:MAG TPA: SRPBCC family protein [Acidimicrobiales bacterium]|nr:SRPBCC family protein [Acidimicrobiales bacterium]
MDEESIDINAPRAKVWDLVADFSNMGRWSPELRRIVWLGGAKGPSVGARFVGVNRHGPVPWATFSKVSKCDDESAIEWEVSTSGTRWGYRFEDAPGGGTRVTEYREPFRDTNALVKAVQRSGLIGRNREDLLRAGMRTTLERVKAAAEAAG